MRNAQNPSHLRLAQHGRESICDAKGCTDEREYCQCDSPLTKQIIEHNNILNKCGNPQIDALNQHGHRECKDNNLDDLEWNATHYGRRAAGGLFWIRG